MGVRRRRGFKKSEVGPARRRVGSELSGHGGWYTLAKCVKGRTKGQVESGIDMVRGGGTPTG